MKVKIGDTIYNSEEQPIMLILNQEERDLIGCGGRKFCSYPDTYDPTDIEEFMKD